MGVSASVYDDPPIKNISKITKAAVKVQVVGVTEGFVKTVSNTAAVTLGETMKPLLLRKRGMRALPGGLVHKTRGGVIVGDDKRRR